MWAGCPAGAAGHTLLSTPFLAIASRANHATRPSWEKPAGGVTQRGPRGCHTCRSVWVLDARMPVRVSFSQFAAGGFRGIGVLCNTTDSIPRTKIPDCGANACQSFLLPVGGVIRVSELEPLFPILVQSPARTSSGPGFANLTSCSAALPGASDVRRRGCSGMSGRVGGHGGPRGGVYQPIHTKATAPLRRVWPAPAGARRMAGLRSCCVPAMLCVANNSPHVSEMGAWPRPGPP